MARRGRRKMADQDSDYDGAWKEVLRQHLREILEKYLPAIAAEIDWRHPPQWSDKELGRILRQRRRRPKSVDMLVKVCLLNGAEQWILLHLEIQSSREAGFEFRIFRYNLYDLGYNADEVREIFRLIDWMMSLPEDLSRKFEEELVVLEESLNMPYVTSVERIAEARGKQDGKQEGVQSRGGVNLGQQCGNWLGNNRASLPAPKKGCGPWQLDSVTATPCGLAGGDSRCDVELVPPRGGRPWGFRPIPPAGSHVIPEGSRLLA